MGFLDRFFRKRKDSDYENSENIERNNNVSNDNSTTVCSKQINEIQEDTIEEKPTIRVLPCEINMNNIEFLKNHFIAFDVETTGLNPFRDRIIELGAVEFENGELVKSFSTLVNAEVDIPLEASRVNNITNDMIVTAPSEEEAYNGLIDFLGEALNGKTYMCAHNASFDFDFLENTFQRLGLDANIKYVDTLKFCRKNITGVANYKQKTLEKFFEITNEKAHRAVSDAKACGEILLKTIEHQENESALRTERMEKSKPSSEELEACAVIKNILDKAGFDTSLLRFERISDSRIICSCLYTFLSFKFMSKGRYIIVPENEAKKSGKIFENCAMKEGEIGSKRVFFKNPMEIEAFEKYIIKQYKERDRYAKSYVKDSDAHELKMTLDYISQSYKMSESEKNLILEKICKTDYSFVPVPTIEPVIKREDVQIKAVNNRISFESIEIREYDWNDEIYSVFNEAEDYRKAGQYEKAISLYEKIREAGLLNREVYTGFAKAYHSLKDYDNEIAILDEGIVCHKEGYAEPLIVRRDMAIKTLYKKQQAEQVSAIKAEEKKRKQEEKARLELDKKTSSNTNGGRRAVVQMDDEGNIIAEYDSIIEAAEAVGINTKSIREVAKGRQKHAAGYCWMYKE